MDLPPPPPTVAFVVGFPAGAGLDMAWDGTFVQVTGMPASLDLAVGRRWRRSLGPWGVPYVGVAAYAWSTPLLFGGPLHVAPGGLLVGGWTFAVPGGLTFTLEAGGFVLWVPPGSEGNQASFTPGPRAQFRLGWGR